MFERVNVGCGDNPLPGYINLDIDAGEGRRQCDVREGLPFVAGSMAEVRADQFLEHLTLAELAAFLDDCKRVLCVGGEVRFSFPDIDGIAKAAARGDLDGVPIDEESSQADVPKGFAVLNFMHSGWGHKAILTTTFVERMIAERLQVTWRAIVVTNGLVIAVKERGSGI